MMPSQLIVSIITLFWVRGVYLSKEKQVFQTPTELLVKPKDGVNLSLTHKIPSYDTVLWYQRSPGNTSLKLIGYVYYKNPKVESEFQIHFNVSGDGEKTAYLHILNPRHPEESGEYFGAARYRGAGYPAEFGEGTRLTVLEKDKEITGPSVKVLQPSPKECKNEKDKQRKKTLVCVAKDFYPDHVSVSWEINGQNVTNGVATDEAAQLMPEKKFYQITSRLRVPAKDWENSDNEFKCIVNFFNKTHTVPYTDSIYGEAVTTTNVMTREKYVKITQAAKLTYSVFIAKSCIYGAFVVFLVWKLQGSKGKQNY